jgi:serine/threonine-protein kinase
MLAVSGDGMLAYVEGSNSNPDRSLVWVDRQGRESPIDSEPRLYSYPRISPDGHHVALDIRDQERDIWILNFDDARTLTKLTFDPETDVGPVWSPDGKRIAYFTNGKGLRWQAEDGTGSVETLTTVGANLHAAGSFTADRKSLVIVVTTGANPAIDRDVKILHIAERKLEPLLADPKFSEDNPQLSPDGKWLAYQSNESGRFEISVRPFPDVQAGRWRISHDGGTRPVWSRDGRELFFLTSPSVASNVANVAPNVPVTMMSASVHSSPTFHTDNPVKLFSGLYFAGLSGTTYDVAPKGDKFLMIKPVAATTTQRPRILIVENWFEELNKLVPLAK